MSINYTEALCNLWAGKSIISKIPAKDTHAHMHPHKHTQSDAPSAHQLPHIKSTLFICHLLIVHAEELHKCDNAVQQPQC